MDREGTFHCGDNPHASKIPFKVEAKVKIKPHDRQMGPN